MARAVFVGLRRAVEEMLEDMARYEGAGMSDGGIIGTGVDIVENERMDEILTRHGARFKDKVFSDSWNEADLSPKRVRAATTPAGSR